MSVGAAGCALGSAADKTADGPSLVVNPQSIVFGTVATGTTSSLSVTMANAGNEDLTITQSAISGTGFGLRTLPTTVTIPAGSSAVIQVTYAPKTVGDEVGSLSFTTNEARWHKRTLPVKGKGVPTASPVISISPSILSFGNMTVGTSTTKAVTIQNTGNASMSVQSVVAGGSGYTVSGMAMPATLIAGASASVSVTFAPTAAGSSTGTVSITSDAPTSPSTVALNGTGQAVSAPAIAVSPASLAFGNVTTGSTASQTVTIQNTGTGSLTINSIAAGGTGFSTTGMPTPATVAAGASASFTVKFAPTTTGSASGSVAISSNAPTSPSTVALSGAGTADPTPAISLSPALLAFGNVATGTSGTQSVTIQNTGTASMTINSVSASGTGYTVSGIATPATVAAGASASFSVKFAPTATGNAPGSVSISSNAPTSPSSVTLTGAGTAAAAPAISILPTSLAFGNVTDGTTGVQSVTVKNTGTSDLTISSATASGTGYTMSGLAAPATISAGSSASFSVTFAPTTAGSLPGSISLVSNAPNSPSAVTMTGTGAATAPAVSVSSNTVAFGNVNDGSTGTQTLTITNSGNANLNLTQVSVSGTGFTGSGVATPATLTAGQSATVTITFAPTTAGSASGNVMIASNASTSPSVSLTGTGMAAAASPVTLSWSASASSDVVAYNVYRSTVSGGQYTLVAPSNSSTSFTDSNVTAGQTYYYVVTSVDGNGNESSDSNQASVSVPLS